MTPKEKAKELVDNIFQILVQRGEHHYTLNYTKQCALLAAENIRTEMVQAQNYERAIYWRDVKSQIRML
jgi:hypothetical protein